jgi:F-type H+-transporting ATPase subunit gamma
VLHALDEAVSAMRALSAHHFRRCRAALPAARAYSAEVGGALAETGVRDEPPLSAAPGLLLVSSDLGLCGDYDTRLAQAALDERRRLGEGPLFVVGRRTRSALAGAGVETTRRYDAPTSVDALPRLLLALAQDLLDDLAARRIGSLTVVSARFEGAGRFCPPRTSVLPVGPGATPEPPLALRYGSRSRLVAVAVREFLYTTLHEILLDALASEHGMRLLAAEAARRWIGEASERVRRRLRALGRETATQEVLDIVAGARASRGRAPGGRYRADVRDGGGAGRGGGIVAGIVSPFA